MNIWEAIIKEIPDDVFEGLDRNFHFVKACIKRVTYMTIQGGKTDSEQKIHRTLHQEEKAIGKDLTDGQR